MILAAVRAARAAGLRAAVLALAATGAHAADAGVDVMPSAVERCLTRSAGEDIRPAYPPALVAAGRGGSVSAAFTFAGPDQAPSVKFDASPGANFDAAVVAYARALRVPCLGAGGATATLQQSFEFVPATAAT